MTRRTPAPSKSVPSTRTARRSVAPWRFPSGGKDAGASFPPDPDAGGGGYEILDRKGGRTAYAAGLVGLRLSCQSPYYQSHPGEGEADDTDHAQIHACDRKRAAT